MLMAGRTRFSSSPPGPAVEEKHVGGDRSDLKVSFNSSTTLPVFLFRHIDESTMMVPRSGLPGAQSLGCLQVRLQRLFKILLSMLPNIHIRKPGPPFPMMM
jgi:hypothetical protein